MGNPTMLFGFSETRTVPLGELGGTLHQYTQEKTGARLCWIERAEENVARLTRLRGREGEVLRLLDIPPRPLVERERAYIAAWDDMGFDDEALRMAYERTVLKKQSMDWGYMNGILRRWHEKGLHTAAAIQAGDRDPRPVRAGGQRSVPVSPAQTQRDREDMERMRRLMEQMKGKEDEGHGL